MMEINKIYNENCLETMARMPDKFIDLVVTSPPYDELRDYNGYSFNFEKIAKELYRVLKVGGVLVWVVNDSTIDGSESLTSFKQIIHFVDKCKFSLHDTMIYEKNGCALPTKVRYLASFEYMFVLSRGKPKTFNPLKDRENRITERWGKGRVVREKDGSLSPRGNYKAEKFGMRFNIWRYNNGAGYGTKDKIAFEHPATFPEKLVADHIYSWSNENDVVYDPFLGSGTTAKMANAMDRKWVGSDVSKDYCDIAKKRLEKHLNQADLFKPARTQARKTEQTNLLTED